MIRSTRYFANYLFLFSLSFFNCEKQNDDIDNLVTFAKVYGYIKYFHPSDEAAGIDWERFSIYGASMVEKCRTKKELIVVLKNLFEPIAPSIVFATDLSGLEGSKIHLSGKSEGHGSTYWQHWGVGRDMDPTGRAYESLRSNRDTFDRTYDWDRSFDLAPEPGETIKKEIGDGIFLEMPIALYCNDDHTFPRADKAKFNGLKEALDSTDVEDVRNRHLRIGNIVNVFNVFQHFYPYLDEIDVDWPQELREALERSYTDKDKLDHLVTLEKFTAKLRDGHMSVRNRSIKNDYVIPITWEWVEGKLVVTGVYENGSIDIGDVVSHIDGRTSSEYFEDVSSRISAATMGWSRLVANSKSRIGRYGSKMELTVNGRDISLKRNIRPYVLYKALNGEGIGYKELEEGIWYLDIRTVEMDTIEMLLPRLEKSDAIICDLRGYPNRNHGLINHLLPIDDTASAWMRIPKSIYPDQGGPRVTEDHDWMEEMKRSEPYLGDKEVIFLTDGRAISYAESFMGYIEGYDLATIIGQPTAGTNGNINTFDIPGGYKIRWTGMKVLKHDGSRHHGIGIIPEIYVKKTIEGVREGRDEFLEKALEVIKSKDNI